MDPFRYKSYNANTNKHTNYYLYQILYQGFKKCQELQFRHGNGSDPRQILLIPPLPLNLIITPFPPSEIGGTKKDSFVI